MAGNSFGTIFRLTTFGESHGEAIGFVVDGCPAGLNIDIDFVQQQLDLRKPGQSRLSSQRKESDTIRFLSGIYREKSTGAPIAAIIENEDAREKDYDHLEHVFRPSHADYTWFAKYGIRDHRGGGRSSARETACRVAAGAIAQLLLHQHNIKIFSYVSQVGELKLEQNYQNLNLENIYTNPIRCPDESMAEKMTAKIEEIRKAGDSIGGVVTGVVMGCPAGLGEPVFDRLQADLAKAMMSINAAKGFDYGEGFEAAAMIGSEHNDPFAIESGKVVTTTNHSGGIQGGISNGMDIYFRVVFKAVSTIMQDQQTVTDELQPAVVKGKGRHDPCVLPRAVPVVEAMTALVLADHLLRWKTAKIS